MNSPANQSKEPQSKVGILIVDDSAVIRGMLTKILGAYDFISILGTASDGDMAIKKARELKPDIILLDIEMPVMDGLTALPILVKENPEAKVIIVSSLTSVGSKTTIQALSLGATDFVAKPSARSLGGNKEVVENELISKIRILGRRRVKTIVETKDRVRFANVKLEKEKPRPEILVIGASTGGPHALGVVLPKIRISYPIPIVIVQHMPPLFTRLLAERLEKETGRTCKEAQEGEKLEPGHIYIAPGDFHLVIGVNNKSEKIFHLNQLAPVNFCRPAVDPLFESAAKVYGRNLAGAVLTGMGEDGKRGSEAIRNAGGFIIAQDEGTSVVWGMPGSVVKNGFANNVLPLDEIGSFLDSLV